MELKCQVISDGTGKKAKPGKSGKGRKGKGSKLAKTARMCKGKKVGAFRKCVAAIIKAMK